MSPVPANEFEAKDIADMDRVLRRLKPSVDMKRRIRLEENALRNKRWRYRRAHACFDNTIGGFR